MHATMIIAVPILSGYAKVRHLPVSLPRVDALIDQSGKYSLPAAAPANAEQQPIGRRRHSPNHTYKVVAKWSKRAG